MTRVFRLCGRLAARAPEEWVAPGLASWSVQLLEVTKERLDVLGRDLVQGPAELGSVIANTKAALMTGMGVGAFTYVVILLLVGIGVEWLYWSYAYAS